MRRLVVLCLIAGVGLTFASTEKWITSPEHQYVIPNPEPGIFPEAPELFHERFTRQFSTDAEKLAGAGGALTGIATANGNVN